MIMFSLSQLPPEKQLDFWLGEWDVSWGDDQRGTNHITRELNDRVIEENFDGNPAMAFQGRSVSVYSAKLGQWQQTWVDTEGNYWHFLGGAQGDEFIFAADDLIQSRPVKLRMVFSNIDTDQLDWRWERSDDGGRTWELKWKISYRRKGR